MNANNAPRSADQLSCGMQNRLTSKQKMERLRAALRQGERTTDKPLLDKLERCGTDWNRRFPCRSPACVPCRHRHIRQEQRITANWFGDRDNSDLAFVSVVLGSASRIDDVSAVIASSREATRKRVSACRRDDPRWNGVYLSAWHEIDAVGADHMPLLPPQRRNLVEQIASMASDQLAPMWLPSWHGIIRLNGLSADDVACQFRRTWKVERQVDVRAFDLNLPVATNLAKVTSYANKFECKVSLTGQIKEPWPVMWQAEFFGWLNSAQRNPFESLRMTVNQRMPRQEIEVCKAVESLSPMPFVHSLSGVPMSYNTRRWA